MTTLTTRATKGSALDYTEGDDNVKRSAQTKGGNYTVVEGDNRDTIEVTATATITLPDAATIAAAADTDDFEVTLKNISTSDTVTVTCTTGADTIDESTADITLAPMDGATLKVNQTQDGYNIINDSRNTVYDENSNELLTFSTVASALNNIEISNNATTANPQVRSAGESDIGITFLDSNTNVLLILKAIASAQDYLRISNDDAGALDIDAIGISSDIDINLTPKGDGGVKIAKDGTNVEIASISGASGTALIPEGTYNIGNKATNSGWSGNILLDLSTQAVGVYANWKTWSSQSGTGNLPDAVQVTSDGTNARISWSGGSGGGTLSLRALRLYKI